MLVFGRMFGAGFVTLLLLSGCGGSAAETQEKETKTYNSFLGSCSYSMTADDGDSFKICYDVSFKGTLTEDPSSSLKTEAKSSCAELKRDASDAEIEFKSDRRCSTQNSVAQCFHEQGKSLDKQSYTLRANYILSGDGLDQDTINKFCKDVGANL